MRARLLPMLMGLFLVVAAVCAEEIQLKDGTKITGRILGVNGDVFQVKTSYGEINVPRSDIISINFPENQPKPEAKEETLAPPVDEVLEGTLYINRTSKFRMTIPDDWEIAGEMRKKQKDIVAALASKNRALMMLVTIESFSGSMNSYKGLAEMQYQMNFQNYQKLSENEVSLDGRKGIQLIWRALVKESNNAPLKSQVIIVPYEGRMVRISFLTVEPLFDEAIAMVEKSMMTYATLPQ